MNPPIRVLLIEDNPADAELTRETLESGKLRVDIAVAPDGPTALEMLIPTSGTAVELPDLILLDLNLPRIHGREVLVEIRRHPHLRCIPVVILTSSDAEHEVAKSYELGANCFVTKPVGLHAFREIVRSVEDFWFTVVKLP